MLHGATYPYMLRSSNEMSCFDFTGLVEHWQTVLELRPGLSSAPGSPEGDAKAPLLLKRIA